MSPEYQRIEQEWATLLRVFEYGLTAYTLPHRETSLAVQAENKQLVLPLE